MIDLIYSDNTYIPHKGIFLAGPTLRNGYSQNSWRYKALKLFDKFDFDGQIFIPEYEPSKTFIDTDENIKKQTYWEWEALDKATAIMFWIPRDIKTLPGFTTNIEFGRYTALCPEKIVLGYPSNAPKMRYIELLYQKTTNRKSNTSLVDTVKETIKLYNERTKS